MERGFTPSMLKKNEFDYRWIKINYGCDIRTHFFLFNVMV